MTLSVSLVGTGKEPLVVRPIDGHPDTAVIRVGADFCLMVRAADIERLSCALDQAREVLTVSARDESKE
ncbi:hypothetical protein [Paractinoplanes atraurantiacus]|uniref:Uncharacterized protein n=1 Tax=Paractinoplanes atraurantiacus TaxID=1036182 RepID=A0A285FEC6_9ACTN|nr:hypothetical protein [Actinoplanes atraurantiacus]SNY09618.1 hypothetical protein SAMN05421748_101893 [Actinoplanes atraurantiacus]